MPDGGLLLIAALVVGLTADVANGWTGTLNATAAVVSARVLPPAAAVLMAAVLNRTMINVALRTSW